MPRDPNCHPTVFGISLADVLSPLFFQISIATVESHWRNTLKQLHLFNQKGSSLKKGSGWFFMLLGISPCGLHPKVSRRRVMGLVRKHKIMCCLISEGSCQTDTKEEPGPDTRQRGWKDWLFPYRSQAKFLPYGIKWMPTQVSLS